MSVAKLLELAQNPSKLKEICKEDQNTICPKRIYKHKDRIVIEYEHETITIPIKRKDSYEQWVEKRDKKLLKVFRKLRQLKAEYNKQREIVRKLRLQYYQLKNEFKQLEKEYKLLKIPTLEQLLSEKNMELIKMRGKYRTEQAKLRVIKSHIKTIKRKFERARKVAKMQFEAYKPMHSLPTSAWKKRIKMVLETLDSYLEKGDMLGLVVTKKLNHKDIETIVSWHEWLNEQIYELTFELLIKHIDNEQDKKQKFKKPLLAKMLQNELYSFNFDSVMKTVALWLKTKP
jgi:hypothetical protein